MNTISNDLKKIVQEGLMKTPLPVVKGKATFIGGVVIRESDSGFHIFDTKKKERICTTLTKHGAIGVAKKYINNSGIDSILFYDKKLSKHQNDKLFFKNSLQHTKNSSRKEILQTRLDESTTHVEQMRNLLEDIIFS